MKVQKIKFKNSNKDYSILIGNNILKILSLKIKPLCPQTKKVALIFDKGVPSKYKKIILNNLKKYEVYVYNFNANEKTKSIKSVNSPIFIKFHQKGVLGQPCAQIIVCPKEHQGF